MGWLERLFSRGAGPAVPQVNDPTDSPLPEAPLTRTRALERTYQVRQGDTLESIARTIYGSPAEAQRLLETNRARLGDPPVLFPGQVLRLP